MQIGLRIKRRTGNLLSMLLLVLFLGYYGGITLFPHAHIVNGVTIVHSHPYSSGKGNSSIPFPHTGKELVIIQLLSEFLTTVFALLIIGHIFSTLPGDFSKYSTSVGYAEPGGNRINSLRAPPFEVLAVI